LNLEDVLEFAVRAVSQNVQSVGTGGERIRPTNQIHVAAPVAAFQFDRPEHLSVGRIANFDYVATVRAHGHEEPEDEASALAWAHNEVAIPARLGQLEGWKRFGNNGRAADPGNRSLPANTHHEGGQKYGRKRVCKPRPPEESKGRTPWSLGNCHRLGEALDIQQQRFAAAADQQVRLDFGFRLSNEIVGLIL
jgi:hypothetical protein